MNRLAYLTETEKEELNALRLAISHNPAAIATRDQERFTALFTRSLIGKGDRPVE